MLKIATSPILTRPADTTAYASGDLVANSTTAGSVTPLSLSLSPVAGGLGFIRHARLLKSGTGVTNAAFRVHFYETVPTVTNGDNGAWLSTRAGWLGSVDVTIDKAFSNGAAGIGIPTLSGLQAIVFKQASAQKRIFALIEARGAYTPASAETFTVEAAIEYEPA